MISYEEFVSALVKPGKDIAKSITPEEANLWHLATGAAGEGGELLDAVKKHVIYKKELDRENIIEELGDIEFYCQGIRTAIGVTREEVIEYNMIKLKKRYDEKYSDAAAIARADKTGNE